MATIQRLPALMGEVDVLKAIQMLPAFNPLEKATAVFTCVAEDQTKTSFS